ncbi:MAG: toll/interleukin-1 receptor domain-containing protein, partial [Halocynthiibacter sp.]
MTERARIFISYSRKNAVVALRLFQALNTAGYPVLIDSDDILDLEQIRQRLADMIRSSDFVLLLLSTDWLESDICTWELEFAGNLNKRLVPVALEDVGNRLPPLIADINYIPLYGDVDFDTAVERIERAFGTDIGWVRDHTRYGELANRWASGEGLELRGKELTAALTWLESQPSRAPPPTHQQRQFISRSEHRERRVKLVRRGAALGLLAATAVIAFLLNQYFEGVTQNERRQIASNARKMAPYDPVKAIQTALGAWAAGRQDPESAPLDALAAVSATFQSQRLRALLTGQKGAILHADYTPDGKSVITGSAGQTVLISDSVTGAPEGAPLDTGGPTRALSFSARGPGGGFMVAGAGNMAVIWNLVTRRRSASLPHDSDLLSALFSARGNMLITGTKAGRLRILNPQTGKLIRDAEYDAPVVDLELVGSKDIVAVVSGGTLSFLDLENGERAFKPIAYPGVITDASISPDGRFIAAASANKIAIWAIATGQEQIAPIAIHSKGTRINSIEYSGDGSRLVTAASDRTARVIDASSGEMLLVLRHEAAVNHASFSPEGDSVVTASDDGVSRIFDVSLGTRLYGALQSGMGTGAGTGGNGAVSGSDEGPVVSPQARYTAQLSEDSRVVVLGHAGDSQPVFRDRLFHSSPVVGIAFSPDESMVVTATEVGLIRVWDTQTGLLLFKFEHRAARAGAATATETTTGPGADTGSDNGADNGTGEFYVRFSDDGDYVLSWRAG